jgi:Tannase and feruloyl esterase
MTKPNFLPFASVCALVILAGCGGGAKDAIKPLTCADMARQSVPTNFIALPTNGAFVTAATIVPAAGSGTAAVPEYCKVFGQINPIDSNAPPIKFQLNLPTEWNGKAVMFGGGGYNGVLSTFPSGLMNVQSGPLDKPIPLGRNYATYGSDSGHTLKPPFIFGRDASFAVNDEALANFAGNALKKTHDAAEYLIKLRYGAKPGKSYFTGGSTGGREALKVVQTWPADFDGVVAWYPAWNSAAFTMASGKLARAMAAPGAYLNVAKRSLILSASLAACDELDGLKDDIVSNMAACNARFDPATATLDGTASGAPLRCAGGVDLGDICLSDAQIGVLNTFNGTTRFNFTLASGETGYPGYNVWGSDLGIPDSRPALALNAILGLNAEAPAHPMNPNMPYGSVFYDQWMKYFVTRDANFNGLSVDPENPGPWAQRISALSLLQDINNTDLSAFNARGGKLIMAHGTADTLVSSRATAQYFERLNTKMGAATVANFVRYYEVPGYGHSLSRTFNGTYDSLTALENWVEKGIAPTGQITVDSVGVPGRSRPMCEYPTWPRYNGTGDVKLAASFTCVR